MPGFIKSTVSKVRDSQQGLGKVGIILIILFGGALVKFGFPIASYHYTHLELQSLFEHQARTALNRSENRIRHILLTEIRLHNLDVNIDEDLIVEKRSGQVRLALSWVEVLDLDLTIFHEDWYWELWVFEFDIDETAEISRR